MERHLVRWSYWLGVALTVGAVVFRAVRAFVPEVTLYPPEGPAIDSTSFIKGAVLFYTMALATVAYSWMSSKKDN